MIGTANILRVAGHSRVGPVAGAIAGQVREHGYAEVQAIGVDATYTATLAVIRAREFLRADGLDIVFVPQLVVIPFGLEERTGVRFLVEARRSTVEEPGAPPPDSSELVRPRDQT